RFLAGAAKRFGKKAPSLAPEAANLLLRYTWPGNVRELENALERALALARSDRIGVDDLPPELGAAPPTVQTADGVRTLAEGERDYIRAARRRRQPRQGGGKTGHWRRDALPETQAGAVRTLTGLL